MLPPMPLETATSQSSSGSYQTLPPLAPSAPLTQSPADKFDILDLFAPLGQALPESSNDQNLGYGQQPTAQTAGDFYSANPPPPPQAPVPPPAPLPQSQEVANLAAEAGSMAELEDENDDTVKSINDALRGLFR
jgi:hypothetical protein